MAALLLLSVLLACAPDPHQHILASDPEQWAEDADLKAAVERLTDEERQALLAYMTRRSLGGAFGGEGFPPLGVTIEDALAEQKAWSEQRAKEAAEAAALAARVKTEREAKQAEMREAMIVALSDIEFIKANIRSGRFGDYFAVAIAFENKTDKPVAGIKGRLVFADMFGDEIKQVNVAYDEGVPAGGTSTWKAELDFNQFSDEDKKLATTPLEKLSVTWVPTVLIHEDGSTLSSE